MLKQTENFPNIISGFKQFYIYICFFWHVLLYKYDILGNVNVLGVN